MKIKVFEKLSKLVLASLFLLTLGLGAYIIGYNRGFLTAQTEAESYVKKLLDERIGSVGEEPAPVVSPPPKPVKTTPRPSWGGPELWEAVNKRRQELGVNPLSTKSELCTIAAIRLNQILELGKLDGHEGFSKMPEERPDLKWIFDKYNISEFLLSGGSTPGEAVSLWENTLGHKQLMSGGEYVWGCVYASYGFAVAIAAF